MQYLLTEEEFKKLQTQAKKGNEAPNEAELQKFCTRVANELPIQFPWEDEGKLLPWGCILTVSSEHYCDECPAQDFCPTKEKIWSK